MDETNQVVETVLQNEIQRSQEQEMERRHWRILEGNEMEPKAGGKALCVPGSTDVRRC